jgi:hypothetical protein
MDGHTADIWPDATVLAATGNEEVTDGTRFIEVTDEFGGVYWAPARFLRPLGSAPAVAPEFRVVSTRGGGVYARTKPMMREHLGQLWVDGTRLVPTGKQARAEGRVWYEVAEPSGAKRWITQEFVAETAPLARGQRFTVVSTAGGGIYMRDRPRQNPHMSAIWRDGTVLVATGREADADGQHWYEVTDPAGATRRISAKFARPI